MTFKLYAEYYNEETGMTLVFKTDRGFFTGHAKLHEGEERVSKFIAGEIAEMKARRSYYKDKEKVFCELYDRRGNRVKSIWMNFRKRSGVDNNIEGIIKKLTIMDY